MKNRRDINMKKSIKYTGIIAAALLAVAPVFGATAIVTQPTVVKAATGTPDENGVTVKLTKKSPYIKAYNGETVLQLRKTRVNDVTSNYGKVSKLEFMNIYHAFDNGEPDYGSQLKAGEKLKSGKNYVALLSFTVTDLPNIGSNVVYNYLQQTDADEAPQWGYVWGNDGSLGEFEEPSFYSGAAITVPVKVSNKKVSIKKSSTKKVNLHGYVKVKKNHKVRTYTSSGKFSKHYVYGHHTYKLNQKKNIKGHGTCYKIYGKSQWIPAKYLRLRK